MVEDAASEGDEVDELRRIARFFHSIIENIPDLVFVKDAETLRYVIVNRATEQLMGMSREALVGRTDLELFPVEVAEKYRADDRQTLKGRDVVEIPEERLPTGRGDRILHTKKIVLAEGDTPSHLLGISQDITERRNAELELEKLRGAVAAAIVHDLRAPLQSILFQLETARSGEKQAVRAAADEIRRDVERIHRLTTDMLDWTRVAIEDVSLEREIVDLAVLVPQIVDGLRAHFASHPIEVRTHELLPPVSVDPVRLEQILRNLIDNAAKYGTPGSAICIDVEPHPDGVGMRVSDCGPGIDPTELPHVFDRFYRSSRATSGTPGFGLGLFITKGLVKAHGGHIAVESVPGHGTVFRIALPAAG